MSNPETKIEMYLKDEVEKLGGIAYKFSSPARRNVPDRLCAFPTGFVAFVEVKASKKDQLRKGQMKEFDRLTALSQPVMVVYSKETVDEFISISRSIIKSRKEKK